MNKYDICRLAEYSGLVYKDIQPIIKNQTVVFISDEKTSVQYFIKKQDDTLYIVFRGTDSIKDLIIDAKILKKVIPYDNTRSKIKVHKGFLSTYTQDAIRLQIHSYVTPDINKIKLSGHSYGAALAVLCAVDLEYNFPHKDYEVVLFGCPKVGNRWFVNSYNKRVFKTIRVENGNDFITKLSFFNYCHVGAKYHIGTCKIPLFFSIKDHSMMDYYSKVLKQL